MKHLSILLIAHLLQFSASAQISFTWPHQTAAGNTMLWWTDLQGNLIDSNDLIVTQHRRLFGETAFDHVTSVLVTSAVDRIINEDFAAMIEDVRFNVLRAGDDLISFTHTMGPGNDQGYRTVIDHPALNGDPDAIFIYSHNRKPNDVINDNKTGVLYNGSKWAIFNENVSADLPDQSSYNIIVPPASDKVFVHTSSTANITTNYTVIDHPDLDGKSNARFFVRHNLSESSGGGYNKNAGVYYQPFIQKWTIYNEDLTNFTPGLAFNIMIPDSDEDGFADHDDRCSGFDDAIDRDQDGTPDYCDDPLGLFCDQTKIIYEDHLSGEILQYQAEFSVTSDRKINSGAEVTFRAEEIFLNPGFEVKAGAVFETGSSDCDSSGT